MCPGASVLYVRATRNSLLRAVRTGGSGQLGHYCRYRVLCHHRSDACGSLIADLDAKGGERFVASHDDEGYDTKNWLHVTSSSPLRRAQYEMRYCADDQILSGVARFGEDCEGPPGCVHGGAIATVADAATATATFKAAGRWGLTTRLECNYREMLPLCTPVKLMATVTSLKARKCVIDWELISLTELDRKGAPVRHAFRVARRTA